MLYNETFNIKCYVQVFLFSFDFRLLEILFLYHFALTHKVSKGDLLRYNVDSFLCNAFATIPKHAKMTIVRWVGVWNKGEKRDWSKSVLLTRRPGGDCPSAGNGKQI